MINCGSNGTPYSELLTMFRELSSDKSLGCVKIANRRLILPRGSIEANIISKLSKNIIGRKRRLFTDLPGKSIIIRIISASAPLDTPLFRIQTDTNNMPITHNFHSQGSKTQEGKEYPFQYLIDAATAQPIFKHERMQLQQEGKP